MSWHQGSQRRRSFLSHPCPPPQSSSWSPLSWVRSPELSSPPAAQRTLLSCLLLPPPFVLWGPFTFSSFTSMYPDPSVSNSSNASLISCFCSSVSSGLGLVFLRGGGTGPGRDGLFPLVAWWDHNHHHQPPHHHRLLQRRKTSGNPQPPAHHRCPWEGAVGLSSSPCCFPRVNSLRQISYDVFSLTWAWTVW